MSLPVYGLTGGIACGKSTAALLLRERGWTVVESDEIAHRLMAPGAENWRNIVDAFGREVLNPDQTINRGSLGDMVFREPRLREKLNSLTHPAIRKAWQQERERFLETISPANTGKSPGAGSGGFVVVIPLLFEVGLEKEFTRVICLGCSAGTQWKRMAQRGLNPLQIEQRLQSQLPLEEKAKRSDRVLWNEGSRSSLKAQIALL
ncbi:MAG: dephospho-CoA kinase [Verrucomicrobium sp.]|nr:dephospho-CoA kinase [Verrucomicrobium sp.]